MALICKVKVEKNKGRMACWLYIPKAVYELLSEPVAFKMEMCGPGKLLLTPLKAEDLEKLEKEVGSGDD